MCANGEHTEDQHPVPNRQALSSNSAAAMVLHTWLCRQCTSVQDKVFNALSTRTTLIWMPEEKNRIKASAETFQSSEERHAKKVKDYS